MAKKIPLRGNNNQEIKRNRVQCKSCNTILESTYRHDFQMCKCDNQTFVDGGLDYRRVGGIDMNLVEILND